MSQTANIVRLATSRPIAAGPGEVQIRELAALTYNEQACQEIQAMLLRRLKDPYQYGLTCVYHSLDIIAKLLIVGSPQFLELCTLVGQWKSIQSQAWVCVTDEEKYTVGRLRETAEDISTLLQDLPTLYEQRDIGRTIKNLVARRSLSQSPRRPSSRAGKGNSLFQNHDGTPTQELAPEAEDASSGVQSANHARRVFTAPSNHGINHGIPGILKRPSTPGNSISVQNAKSPGRQKGITAPTTAKQITTMVNVFGDSPPRSPHLQFAIAASPHPPKRTSRPPRPTEGTAPPRPPHLQSGILPLHPTHPPKRTLRPPRPTEGTAPPRLPHLQSGILPPRPPKRTSIPPRPTEGTAPPHPPHLQSATPHPQKRTFRPPRPPSRQRQSRKPVDDASLSQWGVAETLRRLTPSTPNERRGTHLYDVKAGTAAGGSSNFMQRDDATFSTLEKASENLIQGMGVDDVTWGGTDEGILSAPEGALEKNLAQSKRVEADQSHLQAHSQKQAERLSSQHRTGVPFGKFVNEESDRNKFTIPPKSPASVQGYETLKSYNKEPNLKQNLREHRLPHRKSLQELTATVSILKRIRGYGGFSETWDCEISDEEHFLPVTMKIVHHVGRLTAEDLEKLIAPHVATWLALSHVNLVPFYGSNRVMDDKTLELSMVSAAYPLGNILQYLNKMDKANPTILLRGIAAGLEYLHLNQLVHGDVRGINIMMSDEGDPQLADTGFSTLWDDILMDAGYYPLRLDSLHWAAPELHPDDGSLPRKSPKSDVYAFASTAVEIMTLQNPFYDLTSLEALEQIKAGKHPPRPDIDVKWSPTDELWDFLVRCWKTKRQERPTMTQIRAKLSEFYTYSADELYQPLKAKSSRAWASRYF